VTQRLKQRDPYTNWRFWEAVTDGLDRCAAGTGRFLEVMAGVLGLDIGELVQQEQVAH
jgi:hypothetical protein